MLRVSVAGASGYSGAELVRWLLGHPEVELATLAAGSKAGEEMAESFPQFRELVSRTLTEPDWRRLGRESDVVFLALPHGLSMAAVPELLEAGARVVDLGADFRLRDRATYEAWYGVEHRAPELLEKAVYGLPELQRHAVAEASLVANPGCYPTAAALALVPVLEAFGEKGVRIVVDAKSGVSGAGRGTVLGTHFSEVNENVRPYKVGRHRHIPELEQTLAASGHPLPVLFVPHLIPMTRGILATCYLLASEVPSREEVEACLRRAYGDEPFVRLLEGEALPETKATYGSNFCDLAVRVDQELGAVVVLAAIDNLGKGAASQAIQNMNLMCGLDEGAGLRSAPLFP